MTHKDAPPETPSQISCREWWTNHEPHVARAWGRNKHGVFLAVESKALHEAWVAASNTRPGVTDYWPHNRPAQEKAKPGAVENGLLPCPFCGGEAIRQDHWDTGEPTVFVGCGNLDCEASATNTSTWLSEATWNNRQAQEKAEPVVRCYRLMYRTHDGKWSSQDRPWVDGTPDAALARAVSERPNQWMIEYAYTAPPVERARVPDLENALRMVVAANAMLSEIEDNKTLYEGSPLHSTRCLLAWDNLNTAIANAKQVLTAALKPETE